MAKGIIAQGPQGHVGYFIMSGSARVQQGEMTIGEALPGALLGEMAMIGGTLYSVTAIANSAVTAAHRPAACL
ncbi:MAG: cyclic nucleotide-binding domain-containing protein [Hyphomicrobiales bacterium]